MLFQELSFSATIGAAIGAFAVYVVARCIYDLYFHPLRNFPGPKRAAIWSFYEFYYDVIKDGTYLWEIEKMHQEYGPIIRINSRSLHIHDPEYFNTVYGGSGRKVNKELSAVSGYTFPHSTISTIDHDLHRRRRAILNPYFSKRAIADFEPIIHDRLDALISRLVDATGSTIDLTCAFSAFTADVVIQYFYGFHANYISSEGFRFSLKDALNVLLSFYNLTRFLPFRADTLKSLPLPILGLLNPNFPEVVSAREANKQMVLKYLNKPDEDKKAMTDAKSKSVIVSALTDLNVPEEEKTLDRLLDEGETIIFAGIDTTARTLAVAFFHLLNNKELLMKLRKELSAIEKPDGQRWTTAELEAVPYMRGVVQEAIRLTYGLVVRIPRISAHEALQYKGFVIPPGTPVSQSTYMINNDASAFPNPQAFDPDRWVRAAQDGVSLDKYMVSFSKGSRACLGINLAYAKLYLGIARVAFSLDMELFETTQQAMQVYHTRGFAFPKEGDGAVKARVMGPYQRQ
ncbi:cytochrome P450 [Aspergillus taichungensis]|uniref:Cytochrome P450 n=1 Tax=Aspergillus taichungensis TaxID=482145 RepID=A0A2J5HYJ1_9EURO|nr:cytochrome P450 [Aspergillus taichungensis]